MLVGHYGVAYSLRARFSHIPLVWLVIAVQAVDIAFFILAPLGIERMIATPEARGPLGMLLISTPYTHSLVMTVVYAAIIIAGGALVGRWQIGVVIALALTSHWMLDLIVHTHDLPLTLSEETKVGWGLWRHVGVAFVLEITLLGHGLLHLWRSVSDRGARIWILATFLVLVIVQAIYVFTPAQPTVLRMAIGAQVIYFVTALLAWRIDRLAPPVALSSRPVSG